MRRKRGFIAVLLMSSVMGCDREDDVVAYVCEEPLQKYLDQARLNIENDYEVQRSREILENCPARGFHRRYAFTFPKGALASRGAVDARVTASWCSEADTRTTIATLAVSPSVLRFTFRYPWSTATGKYPQTEFRLNRNSLRGGFFEDLEWTCELQADEPA